MDFSLLFLIASIFAGSGSYYFYVTALMRKEITPHAFSWFVWWFSSAVIAYLQIVSNAWYGSMNMIFIAMFCFGIAAYSFEPGMAFSKVEVACLILGIIAVIVYFLAKDPVLSVTLLILADAFWFAPTFLKSWNAPWSENLLAYLSASLGYTLSIGAMQILTYETIWFVVATAVLNLSLSIMLFLRRRRLSVSLS